MSAADPLLVETVERLLANVCTFDEIEHAEPEGWSAATWTALADAGFPLVGIDEATGGSGGTIFDAAAILSAIGRFAAPVPVAETALTGGWLLARAGLALPDGPVTVVDDQSSITLVGDRLQFDTTVAWARHAERIAVLATANGSTTVVSLRSDQVTVTPGSNLAGEARDRVVCNLALRQAETNIVDITSSSLVERGALSRVVMAAGALGAVAQMTVDYTNQRHQFGKPVATFQAVQLHLITAAQSAVRAQMAADIAVRALAMGDASFEIAAARVIVDDAITLGTRAAHQAHGAMGVTREYPLHHFTRRLWAWRHEWGTTRDWRRRVGERSIAVGPDNLFAFAAD